METYTIDQVLDAVEAAARECHTNVDDYRAAVEKHLVGPKFSEGQVVCRTDAPGSSYYVWGTDLFDWDLRPLNQIEVGPDWVPREAAMKLRQATNKYLPYVPDEVQDALAAFDEVVK